ncbi:hypothetical protein OH77DRAFT_342903 [Trametes cingulata]|nr:hypothetical protein OH77DRAFT_342903 [Trametes cingulata]
MLHHLALLPLLPLVPLPSFSFSYLCTHAYHTGNTTHTNIIIIAISTTTSLRQSSQHMHILTRPSIAYRTHTQSRLPSCPPALNRSLRLRLLVCSVDVVARCRC